MNKEDAVVTIREFNRILVIPEQYWAGGTYQTLQDLEVKEWERVYKLRASEVEEQFGGIE
jgi:hypothetical protein